MSNLPKLSKEEVWAKLLKELSATLGTPTDEHPTAKIWKHSHLAAVITKVLGHLGMKSWTAKSVIQRMIEMGWLHPIALEDAGSTSLYLLDMGAREDEQPSSMEVLQGCEPKGVLCYFGVLALHELTTQMPAFYHVALLRAQPPAQLAPAPRRSDSLPAVKPDRDPLGTLAFRYQDTPCYTTRRDPAFMPGIQLRDVGPRTCLRVTTLEQTMLDTLLHPLRCGGESIVFEAWERGVSRWNPDRLAGYLDAINRDDMDRRVGAMLDLLDEKPGSVLLKSRMENCRARLESDSAVEEPLPLLPKFSFPNINTAWRIQIP